MKHPAELQQEQKLKQASIFVATMSIIALSLVGYGCWLAYGPAGFIVPGLLIWIEISRKS